MAEYAGRYLKLVSNTGLIGFEPDAKFAVDDAQTAVEIGDDWIDQEFLDYDRTTWDTTNLPVAVKNAGNKWAAAEYIRLRRAEIRAAAKDTLRMIRMLQEEAIAIASRALDAGQLAFADGTTQSSLSGTTARQFEIGR